MSLVKTVTYQDLPALGRGTRVAVALSGGADSTLAARFLQEQGCEVLAFHLILFPGHSSLEQARDAARILGLDLNVLDLSREFDSLIIGSFARSYAQGLTPNPCVICNPVIKFGLLWDRAKKLGAELMATGHYARLVKVEESRTPLLVRPADRAKDQTYFLCRLTPAMLARAVFPLAGLTKSEVKSRVAGLGLTPAGESQDVCFLPGGDYRDLVLARLPSFQAGPGDFVDVQGRVMGRHRGIVNYTIGQRRSLGVPGPEPYYVLALDVDSNRVVIGPKEQTYTQTMTVRDLNWAYRPDREHLQAMIQIRYRHRPAPARVTLLDDNRVRVDFDQAQSAVTPGQAAVVYDRDVLLGGGWIERGVNLINE